MTSSGSAATQTSNEELIQFTTGSFMERVTDTIMVDATQSQNTNGNAGTSTGTGSTPGTNFANSSTYFTNQVYYVLNREVAVSGSIGYESIVYGGANALAIHDLTWQIGTTLTPNPRSSLTVRSRP